MRAWLGQSRLTVLLDSPAPDASEKERKIYKDMQPLKQNIRGTVIIDESRGETKAYRLPPALRGRQAVDLERVGAYQHVLEYVSENHPEYGFVHYNNHTSRSPSLPKS